MNNTAVDQRLAQEEEARELRDPRHEALLRWAYGHAAELVALVEAQRGPRAGDVDEEVRLGNRAQSAVQQARDLVERELGAVRAQPGEAVGEVPQPVMVRVLEGVRERLAGWRGLGEPPALPAAHLSAGPVMLQAPVYGAGRELRGYTDMGLVVVVPRLALSQVGDSGSVEGARYKGQAQGNGVESWRAEINHWAHGLDLREPGAQERLVQQARELPWPAWRIEATVGEYRRWGVDVRVRVQQVGALLRYRNNLLREGTELEEYVLVVGEIDRDARTILAAQEMPCIVDAPGIPLSAGKGARREAGGDEVSPAEALYALGGELGLAAAVRGALARGLPQEVGKQMAVDQLATEDGRRAALYLVAAGHIKVRNVGMQGRLQIALALYNQGQS